MLKASTSIHTSNTYSKYLKITIINSKETFKYNHCNYTNDRDKKNSYFEFFRRIRYICTANCDTQVLPIKSGSRLKRSTGILHPAHSTVYHFCDSSLGSRRLHNVFREAKLTQATWRVAFLNSIGSTPWRT